MAYARGNPKTKKELKAMVDAGLVYVFNPSGMFPDPKGCTEVIEMPHNPKPHRYYASVSINADGYIIKGSVK